MKRFRIKKLIVLSQKENKSREITFSEGLNVIIGGNKTGKSSLIKSIFYTLGCELKFENEWKKLIDLFMIDFHYGDDCYSIIREQKMFRVYHVKEDMNNLIIATESFHEYSERLMELLEVPMDCITDKGQEIPATPPLLFRFQYIDQDKGWEKIGESFSNMQYIKDWRGNSNKYVVGFQGEEFYRLKRKRDKLKAEIDSYGTKINHYEEFIKNLKNSLLETEDENITEESKAVLDKEKIDFEEINKQLLNKLNFIEKESLKIDESLANLKNEKYIKNMELKYIKLNIKNLEKDHDFAIEESRDIKCPFCGTDHLNTLENRIEIVKDIQSGNDLVSIIRRDLHDIDENIMSLSISKKEFQIQSKIYKNTLISNKQNANFLENYKNKGKIEVINTSLDKKNDLINQKNTKIIEREDKNESLKLLNSREKRNIINQKIKIELKKMFEILNLPLSYIQLRDFVQVLSKTGSENPRMIYAYHTSLYLYNLSRGNNVFNFLVVDTPNQQGQDEKNLNNIDTTLNYLKSNDGQVIIGTERLTGHEKEAKNCIYLEEERKCLNSDKYNQHVNLFKDLM